jgi:hypothetical protein
VLEPERGLGTVCIYQASSPEKIRGHASRPDRKPGSVRALAEQLPAKAWQTMTCRTTPAGEDVVGRFAFARVVTTHPVRTDCRQRAGNG